MNKLKAIKIIVFFLTFLMVFATLFLLGTMVKKMKSTPQSFAEIVSLEQPAGSSIESIFFNNNNAYLLIKNGGMADRVLILDKEHKLISTIKIDGAKNER